MNGTQHISQEDLALYSMQALTPAEQAEVKAHLESCVACRRTLADVLADWSLVGLSAPRQELPEGARRRFIAAVQQIPQVSAAAEGRDSDRAPVAYPEGRNRNPASGFGWLTWFGWIVAAVAILCAIYLGYRSSALQRQLENTKGQVAQLSATQAQFEQELLDLKDAFTVPDAKQVTLTETRGPARPIGHANYLAKTGTLIFVGTNLHPIPQSKTYELWLIPANGKAPIPAGLFRPDASGSGSVVLPPIPKGIDAKAFGVTIEIASGSQTPTLPIVMAGQ